MPCDGIAVKTMETQIDWDEHFAEEANRIAFAQWLREQGVNARRWWAKDGGHWALGIETDWIGLAFVGTTVEISNERQRDYDRHAQALDVANWHTTLYAGLLVQQQVLQTVTNLGLSADNIAYDANGALTFELNL